MGSQIGDRVIRLVGVGGGIVIFVLGVLAVLYPDDLRGIDTNVIHTLQRLLLDNNNLYLDPERPPFSITQYGPLYYIIADNLFTLLDFDPSHGYRLLAASRMLSCGIFGFGLFQLFRLLNNDLGSSRRLSTILCGLVVLYTYPWYFMARPDVLVFVFLVLFLRLFLRDDFKVRESILFGVIVCAGCLSKQNFIIFGFLAGLYLLRRGAYRLFMQYAAAGGVTAVLFLGVAWVWGYRPTYMWNNIVDGVNNGLDVKSAIERIYFSLVAYHGPVIGLAVLLCVRLGREGIGARGRKLIFLAVGTLLFNLITGLKYGSAINYLNETVVIILVGLGYLLQMTKPDPRRTLQWMLLFLGVQMLAFTAYLYGPRIASHAVNLVNGTPLSIDTDRSMVINYLDEQRPFGHLYVADNMIALSFPGEIILFQEDIHKLTHERGVYDYQRLYEIIEAGELDYLILEAGDTTFFGVDVEKHFERDRKYGIFTVYRKRVN